MSYASSSRPSKNHIQAETRHEGRSLCWAYSPTFGDLHRLNYMKFKSIRLELETPESVADLKLIDEQFSYLVPIITRVVRSTCDLDKLVEPGDEASLAGLPRVTIDVASRGMLEASAREKRGKQESQSYTLSLPRFCHALGPVYDRWDARVTAHSNGQLLARSRLEFEQSAELQRLFHMLACSVDRVG